MAAACAFDATASVDRQAARAEASRDPIRAYVFDQPLRRCFPWLFREYAAGAPAVNHLARGRSAFEPNVEFDELRFARAHPMSRSAASRPETGSDATFDPRTGTLLASLGWEEDASTTMLVANARAPALPIAANDLAHFRIRGRVLLGRPRRVLVSLDGPFASVTACGLAAATFERDGPGGERFAYVLHSGVVSAVFWFGN